MRESPLFLLAPTQPSLAEGGGLSRALSTMAKGGGGPHSRRRSGAGADRAERPKVRMERAQEREREKSRSRHTRRLEGASTNSAGSSESGESSRLRSQTRAGTRHAPSCQVLIRSGATRGDEGGEEVLSQDTEVLLSRMMCSMRGSRTLHCTRFSNQQSATARLPPPAARRPPPGRQLQLPFP